MLDALTPADGLAVPALVEFVHGDVRDAGLKAGSDLLVRVWVRSFGVRATVTNCSNGYVASQHVERLVPGQITNLLGSVRPRVYGTGHHVRGWIHVDDHSAGGTVLDSGELDQSFVAEGLADPVAWYRSTGRAGGRAGPPPRAATRPWGADSGGEVSHRTSIGRRCASTSLPRGGRPARPPSSLPEVPVLPHPRADVRAASVQDDVVVAVEAAQAAAEVLLALRRQGGDDLRARGDGEAQRTIAELLRARRPGDAVLSEEAPDDPARLTADRVWIVDPLDGTREYGESGRSDWAVHVALWERGELTAGAVALPARDLVLRSDDPPVLAAPHPGRPRLAVSRTRATETVRALARALDAELVPLGSAGVKAMSVALGDVDAYVHTGGQYEWDSAAPVAVARAAGLHTSRTSGDPLVYNRPDPLLPDLVVCRPELAGDVLAGLARLGTEVL